MEDEEKFVIKELVKHLGGLYTVKMNKTNTHLIVERATGQKWANAAAFGVIAVTTDWLVDSAKAGRLSAPNAVQLSCKPWCVNAVCNQWAACSSSMAAAFRPSLQARQFMTVMMDDIQKVYPTVVCRQDVNLAGRLLPEKEYEPPAPAPGELIDAAVTQFPFELIARPTQQQPKHQVRGY